MVPSPWLVRLDRKRISVPRVGRIEELNGVFLLTYDEAREFAGRNKRSHLLVLTGRDAAAVSEVIKRLQPSKPLPSNGVVVVIN